jgi:hypothetical protein
MEHLFDSGLDVRAYARFGAQSVFVMVNLFGMEVFAPCNLVYPVGFLISGVAVMFETHKKKYHYSLWDR